MANWYKKAQNQTITGPDMSTLTPSKMEEIKRWLEEKHPKVNWTLEAVAKWVNDNFTGKKSPFEGPKDLLHNP